MKIFLRLKLDVPYVFFAGDEVKMTNILQLPQNEERYQLTYVEDEDGGTKNIRKILNKTMKNRIKTLSINKNVNNMFFKKKPVKYDSIFVLWSPHKKEIKDGLREKWRIKEDIGKTENFQKILPYYLKKRRKKVFRKTIYLGFQQKKKIFVFNDQNLSEYVFQDEKKKKSFIRYLSKFDRIFLKTRFSSDQKELISLLVNPKKCLNTNKVSLNNKITIMLDSMSLRKQDVPIDSFLSWDSMLKTIEHEMCYGFFNKHIHIDCRIIIYFKGSGILIIDRHEISSKTKMEAC